MQPFERPRIKICCIANAAEAWQAIAAGADALGLVSAMPSGPGVIEETQIAEIVAAVPPTIATFLLTSQTDVNAIIDQQRRCGANTLQLVDQLPAGAHRALRAALPGVALVQVIHVRDEQALAEAQAVAPYVDALLLDSGNPHAPIRELGGTGRVHNWAISRRIREQASIPVFLAGGLNAENVQTAVVTVGPFGVDVCSGVRSAGRLDSRKLTHYVAALRST